MPLFAVEYSYVADPERLDQHRPRHRAFLSELAAQGTVLLSGPFGPPAQPGALIIMNAPSLDDVHRLLDADPFREAGLIEDRAVRPWTMVIGDLGNVGA